MKINVGFCQFNPVFMAVEKNLERMAGLVAQVDADLIVFPELATSGYTFANFREVQKVAESSQNGLTAMILKKTAYENKCSLVAGFVERDGDCFYNSSMLVNPDGSCHIYRKIHLFMNEKKFFAPGNLGFKVAPAKFDLKVGMMICYDWIYPESARTLMLKGAQVIAHPANLVLPWCQQAMITRALENRLFTITANRTGSEVNDGIVNNFTGLSQITDTKGARLAQADESEEIIKIVQIDSKDADDKSVTPLNEIISDRRPEFYHS
jgi:predicted amidohydrolase